MKTHKQWKDDYKQMRFPMGVFQIRNTVTGAVFLDSSLNMPALWNRHQFQLELGNHPDHELQAAWKAHGRPAFVYEVLIEVQWDEAHPDRDYREEVKALEQLWREENPLS